MSFFDKRLINVFNYTTTGNAWANNYVYDLRLAFTCLGLNLLLIFPTL